LPIVLEAVLGDLQSRFIPKGRVGRGYRAIARNGRVLFAGDRPIADLTDRLAWVRIQTWHKRILPDDPPRPSGLLVCVRSERVVEAIPRYLARLAGIAAEQAAIVIDVGGGSVLEFVPLAG
jgi:hypothetical protein